MKKLLAGGLALGFVGIGTALLAAPGGAQEESVVIDFVERLDAEVSPTTVAGGGTVTVNSVDSCPGGDEVVEPFTEVQWGYASADAVDIDVDPGDILGQLGQEVFVETGSAPLNEDGSWTVTFNATSAPGDYEFIAICATAADAAGTLGGGHEEPEEPECPDPEQPGEIASLGDEGEPDPCCPVEPLGGDHGDGDTPEPPECPEPTTPTQPTTPSTQPEPPDEFGIWLYSEEFAVTAAAVPVDEEPNNVG